ncbi:efflux RND transporter periplasmic adaptor subunit [Tumebacillus sp. ITR2]|uniref:Efflux RND transporter periplasmic adaptor subunit n=1 Tax=Tumebacillus amylolyticus TaxID=2801339 RepID=A0ABS1JBT6_9BACL|nr:efflux RND transporter periplasmic adaptor subunit [Tumebacillus amylolyticus]MBL0387736.1 efflux RND transporter periplasmic adaptor subunit [Tumebacillus amylolyticus]
MNAYWKQTGLTIASLSLFFAGCAKSPQVAEEATIVPVSIDRATPRDLPETLVLPGRVMPREQTPVLATAAGQVQSVLVQVGDSVKKGQLLATLDTGSSQATLQEAKGAIAGIEAQIRRLQSGNGIATAGISSVGGSLADDTSRKIALLESQVQTQILALAQALEKPGPDTPEKLLSISQQLQRAQSQVSLLQTQAFVGKSLDVFKAPLLQTLQAQLVQAHQALHLAEAQVKAAQITSPFDGVVLSKNAIAGTPSGPGVPLFSVGDVAQVDFEVLVDPTLQARLKQGQAANVQVGEHSPVPTTLASVSPSLDLQAKSFTAHAQLDNDAGEYKPGQVGQALITLDPHTGVLTVPTSSILHEGSTAYVLLAQGETAVKKTVTTGYNNGTYTEILTGLKKDDPVIHEGLDRVQPGTKIQIITSGTSPSKSSMKTSGEPQGLHEPQALHEPQDLRVLPRSRS